MTGLGKRFFRLTALVVCSAFLASCAASSKRSQRPEYDESGAPIFVPVEQQEPAPAEPANRPAMPMPGGEEKPYVISLQEPPRPELTKEDESVELMSINFKSARLDVVVEMLSDNGKNFNYVIEDDSAGKWVRGFTMENITWQEALDTLAKIQNLKVVRENSLVMISSYDTYMNKLRKRSEMVELEKKHAQMTQEYLKSSLESKKIRGEQERTFRSYKLKYVQPEEVKSYLEAVFLGKSQSSEGGKESGGQASSDTGFNTSFSVFPKTSILTAYGPPGQLDQVEERLSEIDVPQKQVFIETRIVEILRNYSRSLGIQWGGQHLQNSAQVAGGAAAIGTVSSSTTTTTATTTNVGKDMGEKLSAVNFPATDITGGGSSAAAISFQLANALGTSSLNARLSALEKDGKSKTVSNPKVTTINGVAAKIESGREIPYQSQAGGTSGGTQVEFKNAVLSLEVTPFITPDRNINMEIVAKKDDADFTNQVQNVPSILTRKIETNVMVSDGGTAVLGGVFENEDATSTSGVPGVSRIPLLGWLFKGESRQETEKELLIFITPKVISAQNFKP